MAVRRRGVEYMHVRKKQFAMSQANINALMTTDLFGDYHGREPANVRADGPHP
jgi:hypothetical protein